MPQQWGLLDIIHQLESSGGTNPKARIANEVGALGDYQMRPAAFKDIQRMFPERWKRKKFEEVMLGQDAREAAGDYLEFLSVSLANDYGIAPNADALLGAYHSGPGNLKKLGPAGLDYMNKGLDMMAQKVQERY